MVQNNINKKVKTKINANISKKISEFFVNKTIFTRGLLKFAQAGILLAYFLCFFCSNAFIYDIRVLRKWDEQNKQYTYFIGLGDFHDKSHSITDLQIKQIDDIVARCKMDRTKLIVEDVCSAPTSGVKICNKFCINSTGGILGGIASKYKNNGTNNSFPENINVNLNKNLSAIDNIEYRFCRVASLAPVINSLNSDYSKFLSTRKITVGCFKNEIINTVNEIRGYNDCDSLKKWYKSAIDSVSSSMNYLKFNNYLATNIADYINLNSSQKNRSNFVKQLLIFDSCLLDAKIVHSIVSQNVNISNISNINNIAGNNSGINSQVLIRPVVQNFIVMAGGSHIRNVSAVLESLGYKNVYQSNVVVKREVATENCPPSNIMSDGFCCKPEAADLGVLERFI